ncbi:hypothetical protein CHLNCDRAFT_133541 [Chlorella variabilis]|uniref:Uncharacterized protein n=1 Tax=Chlorella variabilis TaxID=554065 RepID=E1Z3B0_CHLVA|nr:hypothetical protein CHLNCDRAFT_133541 [Chlorella variabilis]EFN59809.1 hypothetical protein CHLNCDRAFT_133541 [Chlorella variabilis]|eukprot:XP_005851911.1 hypothetical protein CHLNCDRAFT_133541 [Chlorella variabilis]
MTHSKAGGNFTYSDWWREAGGQRDWLTRNCSIPARDVVGFRAPYFTFSEVLGTVLQDLGFLWDSSLTGKNWTQPGHILSAPIPWPYSYCSGSFCGNWSSLSIWEVPAFTLPGEGPEVGRRVDPTPAINMTVLQRLQADFERKRGTGMPVPVAVHEPYLTASATRQQVVKFLQWAFKQPNTWALTFRQYIDWQQAPPGADVTTLLAKYTCDAS